MKRKYLVLLLIPIILMGFLSVGYSQTVSDTSIISMSGADWSLKVDSALASSIDSRNTPYMTAKSSTEKELFLELASLEDCKLGVVQFKVDMAGLTAYKQLPLTEQEIAEGSFRPKNVENSFALFDSDGRKVAHIYGSKITDSKGVEIWLDQNLDNGLLTVILPKPEELATLSFPLLLDPTFGYTNIGASTDSYTARDIICNFTVADNITATYLNVYGEAGATITCWLEVWNDTGSSTPDKVIFTGYKQVDTGAEWHTVSMNNLYMAAGQYWLGIKGDTQTFYFNYDSVGTQRVRISGSYYGIPTSPFSEYTNMARSMSAYINYTVYVEATPTPSPSPTPVPSDMDDTDWWISILVVMLIIINIFLMMLPFALVRFTFGILSLFLCMLALSYQVPLSPYLQTAGLLISALAMLFSVRARE